MPFSPDLHVMAAPSRAYAEALQFPPRGGRLAAGQVGLALGRPALVALVLGTGSSFASTGHLTFGLLLSGFVCWSFVPILQVATAAAIMRSPASSSLSLARRLDLWFMGHAPWSLWIVAATFTIGTAPTGWRVDFFLIATSLISIAWTAVIAVAFCRVVLGDSRVTAIARTALHQAITWTILFLYIGWAVALWPRLVAFAGG
jgi:hypothetical protein